MDKFAGFGSAYSENADIGMSRLAPYPSFTPSFTPSSTPSSSNNSSKAQKGGMALATDKVPGIRGGIVGTLPASATPASSAIQRVSSCNCNNSSRCIGKKIRHYDTIGQEIPGYYLDLTQPTVGNRPVHATHDNNKLFPRTLATPLTAMNLPGRTFNCAQPYWGEECL